MAVFISIHAPRVGSDRHTQLRVRQSRISIHAPRVGSDSRPGIACNVDIEFQSTLPVWGATARNRPMIISVFRFQSTLPVWGATG